jgi:hypothetical protein
VFTALVAAVVPGFVACALNVRIYGEILFREKTRPIAFFDNTFVHGGLLILSASFILFFAQYYTPGCVCVIGLAATVYVFSCLSSFVYVVNGLNEFKVRHSIDHLW